jgi:Leucine-rich repeat (LRR) protein
MKRLLGLLLVMGMVGCGGGDTSSLPKAEKSPIAATPDLPPPYRALQKIPNTRIDLTAEGEIEVVSLTSNRATDETLQLLDGLTHLKNLALGSNQITDAGLVNLKGLINLRTLNLGQLGPRPSKKPAGSKVTDVGLVHLKGLTNLKSLNLRDTQITDAGLVHLKGLTNLQELRLEGTQVTDEGLVHLAGMNLKSLSIPVQSRTDGGLKHYLAALKPSTKLSLYRWKVTNAGLVHLKGLTNLTRLSLPRQITDAGIAELQKALPNCKITK